MTLPIELQQDKNLQKVTWVLGALCHFKEIGLMNHPGINMTEKGPAIFKELDEQRHKLFDDMEDVLFFAVGTIKQTGDLRGDEERQAYLEMIWMFYDDRKNFNKIEESIKQRQSLEKLYAM